MTKRLYIIGAVLGFVLPYAYFISFLFEHGFDLGLFVEQMFANPIASFFAVDVIVSSLVLWIFVFSEGRRLGMKNIWVYVLCNLTAGVSFALPLFLYFREEKLIKSTLIETDRSNGRLLILPIYSMLGG